MISSYKKFLLIFIFIIPVTTIFTQAKFSRDELYSNYKKIENASIRTFSLSSMTDNTSKTRMYLDKKRRIHFAYFDKSIGMPIYVKALNTNISKEIITEKIGHGNKIAMSVYNKTFSPYISYVDTKGSLYYAHTDSGKFESYNIAISSNTVPKNIEMVISSFREPILFIVDKNNMLYVSRFLARNRDFIIDFIYTNRKVESVYPVSDEKGYKLFLEDKETHNVIFAHRSTNTKFRFLEEYPLAKNVLTYSVYYEADRRFSIFYTKRNDNSSIYEERFYNEHFETIEYLKTDKKIIDFNVSKEVDYEQSLAYLTDDNTLYLHTHGNNYNLNELGKVSTGFEITRINEILYAILYYSIDFKELRLSIIAIDW